MKLRRAAAVVSFWGALVIGAGAAYLVNGPAEEVVSDVYVSYRLTPLQPTAARGVAVEAEDLIGVWNGTWGYGRERCTIEVHRASGTTFAGTLKKEGAVITLEGYIDPETRRVHFKETRVVTLGANMGKWSLGINSGSFSPDGRRLSGYGTDEWGTYGWDAVKSR